MNWKVQLILHSEFLNSFILRNVRPVSLCMKVLQHFHFTDCRWLFLQRGRGGKNRDPQLQTSCRSKVTIKDSLVKERYPLIWFWWFSDMVLTVGRINWLSLIQTECVRKKVHHVAVTLKSALASTLPWSPKLTSRRCFFYCPWTILCFSLQKWKTTNHNIW